MQKGLEDLLRHFRERFREDPASALREWFRLQEELRDAGEGDEARALASDLTALLSNIAFPADNERARFFHSVAVFFGSPGPAADLARARECFNVALEHFASHDETGWHARVLHNFATALSNLGRTAAELTESVSLFEQALEWRTVEREIARGVTLHNMGLALRSLAAIEPDHRTAYLAKSAAALDEAADIRARHNLAEGHALSLFHLGLTRELLGQGREAKECYALAADRFDRLGKHDSAAIARERSEAAKKTY